MVYLVTFKLFNITLIVDAPEEKDVKFDVHSMYEICIFVHSYLCPMAVMFNVRHHFHDYMLAVLQWLFAYKYLRI